MHTAQAKIRLRQPSPISNKASTLLLMAVDSIGVAVRGRLSGEIASVCSNILAHIVLYETAQSQHTGNSLLFRLKGTYKVHLVDGQDTGVGMLALGIVSAREADALIDVFCCSDRSSLDTRSSGLADLLVQLEALWDTVGVTVILAEDDSKCGSVFDSLDSSPARVAMNQSSIGSTATIRNLLGLIGQHRMSSVTGQCGDTLRPVWVLLVEVKSPWHAIKRVLDEVYDSLVKTSITERLGNFFNVDFFETETFLALWRHVLL